MRQATCPSAACWDAFQKEESPRTGIPIHDSGPRGLGLPDLIPPPTLEAGWLVLGCRPPQAPEGAGLGRRPTGQGFVAGAKSRARLADVEDRGRACHGSCSAIR